MYRFNKISGFIVIAVAMLFFSACQKEVNDPGAANNNNNNTTTDFKVRKYREDYTSASGNSSQTFNLTYDVSNRLLSLIDSADATTKQVFTYNSNSYTMDFFSAGTLIIHEDFFLNSVPLVDSASQYNNTGDTTLEKYIFDAANHITQVKDYDYTTAGGPQLYGTSDYTYDADGNVLQETDSNAATVTSYQYYTDLNTLDLGKPYEPRNKNLTRKSTIVDGSSTVTVDFIYTYDNLNRVNTQREQYSTGELVVRTYSY